MVERVRKGIRSGEITPINFKNCAERAEIELTKDQVKIFQVNHVNIIGNTFTTLLPSGYVDGGLVPIAPQQS